MLKRLRFKNLVLLTTAGLAAGACSPVAPSVSKLSNAAGTKTNPTDGSSPGSNISIPGPLSSSPTKPADETPQKTEVRTFTANLKKELSLIHDSKKSLVLDEETVDTFSIKGVALFPSNADDVKGQEASLERADTVIYLAVSADPAAITKSGLSNAKARLVWRPASPSNKEPHWELSLVAPKTGDAVKDLNEAKDLQQALHDHLVGIQIAFD